MMEGRKEVTMRSGALTSRGPRGAYAEAVRARPLAATLALAPDASDRRLGETRDALITP